VNGEKELERQLDWRDGQTYRQTGRKAFRVGWAGWEAPHCVCYRILMLFVALATVRMSDFFASSHMLVLQIYCQRNVLSELFGNLFACCLPANLTACINAF